MKILWLYSYYPRYTINHWLNIDFARAVKKQGHKVIVYGLKCEEGYPDIATIPYDSNLTLDQFTAAVFLPPQFYHPCHEATFCFLQCM